MKIIKYVKKGNNTYDIYLEGNQKINLYEDTIIKYNLLYKDELDLDLLESIDSENNYEGYYNKCVKYITVRLRSKNEIYEYLKKKEAPELIINDIIERLIKSKLLNDDEFTRAFVKDKMNFTTMGPYRILNELKKHRIDEDIINKYIYDIDDNLIDEKINKQINKIIKSTKKKDNLRNKIYMNLLNLGYSNEMILRNINKYGNL